jgi:hypothetical protein
MVSCTRCGANIDPSAPVCPYCQTQTAYGYHQAQQAAFHQQQAGLAEQARAGQERAERQQALEKKARYALFWSLGGVVLCCFPAAIVGMVLGLNVKGTARKSDLVAPGSATVAVVVGVVALLLFGAGVVVYVHDSRELNARIAVLEAETEPARAAERVDQRLACGLTELELLKNGFAGTSGINISGFECNGKLEQSGERAQLFDVQFRSSSSEPRKVVAACLVRGARWSVQELRDDGSCAPKVTPQASASAAVSAH